MSLFMLLPVMSNTWFVISISLLRKTTGNLGVKKKKGYIGKSLECSELFPCRKIGPVWNIHKTFGPHQTSLKFGSIQNDHKRALVEIAWIGANSRR